MNTAYSSTVSWRQHKIVILRTCVKSRKKGAYVFGKRCWKNKLVVAARTQVNIRRIAHSADSAQARTPSIGTFNGWMPTEVIHYRKVACFHQLDHSVVEAMSKTSLLEAKQCNRHRQQLVSKV